MVPHADSPDVDRRPLDLSSFRSLVESEAAPGRREYAALSDLDHRRHVTVLSADVGRSYSGRKGAATAGGRSSSGRGESMNRYGNVFL